MAEKGIQTKFRIHEMPGDRGQVIIACADRQRSIGVMTLNPGKELSVHTRPVDEQLVQLMGVTRIDYYDGDVVVEGVTIYPNQTTIVQANRSHSHVNPSEKETSLVMSRFDGDISDVIAMIKGNKKIG